MGAMGDKVTARKTVVAAGVPVVPGTDGGLSDDDLEQAAGLIGYPVMIKASAGGGGKGMRVVNEAGAMRNALASARREAEAAFGDGDVFLEKLVEGARHIEIQILADQHGNCIHLGERECSIQRRHQKLIEESPSPFVDTDEDMRRRMGEVAVRAAQAVGYVNAGTIEFLVDKQRNFYFLEMNTRLQVEHPVTEIVTGVDIVKEQIRIARGRKLRLSQDEVRMTGAAIECRITAEDPYSNFLPSTGTITGLTAPTGPGVRVDSGVYEGFEISPYYDSLIAKLICWGESRGEALLRMRRALEEFRIMGVKTSIPFHQAILASYRFMVGQFDTNFVERHFSIEHDVPADTKPEVAAVLAALYAHRREQAAAQMIRTGGRDISNWKWAARYERLRR
jgi:acetyl/propionyl-CoA carboxylase alpha subunit